MNEHEDWAETEERTLQDEELLITFQTTDKFKEALLDWAEKQEEIFRQEELLVRFQATNDFKEALLSWHRKHNPEEWGND